MSEITITRAEHRRNKRRMFNYWFFRRTFETVRDIVIGLALMVGIVTIAGILQCIGWWMQGR